MTEYRYCHIVGHRPSGANHRIGNGALDAAKVIAGGAPVVVDGSSGIVEL